MRGVILHKHKLALRNLEYLLFDDLIPLHAWLHYIDFLYVIFLCCEENRLIVSSHHVSLRHFTWLCQHIKTVVGDTLADDLILVLHYEVSLLEIATL